MARPDKSAAVEELAESFRNCDGAVLTEYRGLTVKQLQELRRSLGENVHYAVTKNTLTKLAARQAGLEELEELLVGPTAIAFVKGDAVEAAKGLRDFAKANDPLVIKGGYLDGSPLSAAEVKKLADLESREVLLTKLAVGMKATTQNAASLFNAPLAQAARALGALQAKAPAAEASQSEAGNAEASQSEAGNAEASQSEAGNAEASQSEAGNAEASQSEAGNAEASQSEAGGTEG